MALVAILDSGINPGHPHVRAVRGGFNATAGGIPEDWFDRAGHGTAVAGAVHSHAPEAELLAVKIFDGALRTNLDAILRGVEWALGQGAEILNLSLGTTNTEHAPRLAEWVSRGGVWVAAAKAAALPAYPGSLAGVLGVEADEALERGVCRRLLPLRFAASPYPREIPGVSRERNLSGISFAVANLTGILAKMWVANLTVEQAAAILANDR